LTVDELEKEDESEEDIENDDAEMSEKPLSKTKKQKKKKNVEDDEEDEEETTTKDTQKRKKVTRSSDGIPRQRTAATKDDFQNTRDPAESYDGFLRINRPVNLGAWAGLVKKPKPKPKPLTTTQPISNSTTNMQQTSRSLSSQPLPTTPSITNQNTASSLANQNTSEAASSLLLLNQRIPSISSTSPSHTKPLSASISLTTKPTVVAPLPVLTPPPKTTASDMLATLALIKQRSAAAAGLNKANVPNNNSPSFLLKTNTPSQQPSIPSTLTSTTPNYTSQAPTLIIPTTPLSKKPPPSWLLK
jgi:hypothetical protein